MRTDYEKAYQVAKRIKELARESGEYGSDPVLDQGMIERFFPEAKRRQRLIDSLQMG